jgi:hypothetical protein
MYVTHVSSLAPFVVPGGNAFPRKLVRVLLVISLALALFSVHSALARAEGPGPAGISCCTLDADHLDEVLPMGHAAHLAGHLTCVVDPALLVVTKLEATRARRSIPTSVLPVSTHLPAPIEPPRA